MNAKYFLLLGLVLVSVDQNCADTFDGIQLNLGIPQGQ